MSLRICYLMPRLLPTPSGAIVGGSAANCVSLALELKREGMEIELLASISPDDADHLAGSPLGEILQPLSCRGRGLVGKGLGALYSLRRRLKTRLRETRFDVVHSHSGTYPYAVLPLAADRKTVVRLHSLYCPLRAHGGVYSRWWEKPLLARTFFKRLDRVIAVTGNVRQSVEKAGVPCEKIESIPMCVDTQRFHPRDRSGPPRYFSEDDDSVRLLYIGNASKEKGLVQLLYTVKMLINERVRVSLVAAIENQSRVKKYAAGYRLVKQLIGKLAIDRHVHLLGLVDRIEDLYAESDFVVIPWETSRGPSDYPMVALEAMAMGKCVIATPVGGCPELLDHGTAGILTDGFSVASLASAIRCSLANPERRHAVENAAIRRAEELSLSVSAKRMISLYDQLLRAKDHRD